MPQQQPFKINRDAFNDLFRENYPPLRAYAGLLADAIEAEDVVQDVFVYVWEHRNSIEIHTSVKAYLFRAVYTRCLNLLNRRKMILANRQQLQYRLKMLELAFFDPDKSPVVRKLYMNDLSDEINRAIERLPEKCREVFKLSYIVALKNREISERLGISVSTVEKHINLALKTLRKLLQNLQLFFIHLFLL